MNVKRSMTGRKGLRWLLMGVIPMVALAAAGWFYVTGGRYVETEDAYLKADKIMVAPEVSGRVTEVAVQENQPVTAGDLLLAIDATPYRLAVEQAEAGVALVRNELEALRAGYRQKEADLEQAREAAAYAQREYERRQSLTRDRAISQSLVDEARHNLDAAQLTVTARQRDLEEVLAQLGSDDPQTPIEAHPRYRAAQAQLDQARLDLERTRLTAPQDGVVGRLALQQGDYARVGVAALSLLDNHHYVEANLKETELTHVTPGQEATVTVDAYPGRVWPARVASISPATGAEFSVLPPQNATGNWVKVVQRLPVRLELADTAAAPPLRAGMSVTVEIDTGHQRQLPGPVSKALAWMGEE